MEGAALTSVLVAVGAQLKEGKRKDLVAMQNKIMQVGVSQEVGRDVRGWGGVRLVYAV